MKNVNTRCAELIATWNILEYGLTIGVQGI